MLGGRNDDLPRESGYSKIEPSENIDGIKNKAPENINSDDLDDEIPFQELNISQGNYIDRRKRVWRRRKPKQYSKLDYTFTEDPKERALRRIQELSLSQFTKDFYTELSHISREYIEAKYFVRTLEMTTNEIKESRLLFPIENSWFNEWIIFLSLADQVKYALELPDKARMKSDKDKIKSIIIELQIIFQVIIQLI